MRKLQTGGEMTEPASIYEALFEIQNKIQPVSKNAANPFFKSKYADIGSVWDAIRPLLQEQKLLVSQACVYHDGQDFLKTTLYHLPSRMQIDSEIHLILSKNDLQGMGSAITYARRYALVSMLNLLSDDDDGNKASTTIDETAKANGQADNAPSKQKAGKLRGAELTNLHDGNLIPDEIVEGVFKKYGVKNFEDLPKDVADKMIDKYKEKE
jgi:hypothetical protein